MKQEILLSIKKEQLTTKLRGFLLVEVLLASSIFVLFLTAFSGVFYYAMQSSVLAGNRSQATMLAEEGQEAVRSMKNVNFANIADGAHGLVYSNNAWSFSGTQDVSGAYTRQVNIQTIDANRKSITTSVTWQQTPGRVGTISTVGRLTNWKTLFNLGQGLTVNSVVINHGLSKVASDFAPYKVGTTTVQLATATAFSAGTYAVSETVNSNYIQTFSGDCNTTGQVTITASSSNLCTITNEEKLSYVIASSTVINHGGSKVPADFAPYKVGSTTVTLNATTPIDSGTYKVTNATTTLYTTTYSGGCLSDGTITLISGDTKTCMITNEEVVAGLSDGLLIYGDGTAVPKLRTYNYSSNTFSAESPLTSGTIGKTWIIKTSPIAHVAVAGYYDSAGLLTIMCFNGTSWSTDFTVQLGGTGKIHRFDIAFERTSGDALVFYAKGTNSQLGYRTKAGSTGCGSANWTAEAVYTPVRTINNVMFVKMAQDRRYGSNIIAAAWSDLDDALSAAIWNGTTWVNEPSTLSENNLQKIIAPNDIEDIDLEYESLSGNLMLVWSNELGNNGVNGIRYRTCNGGTAMCTWSAVTLPPVFVDDGPSLDISANPQTNEIVFASIGKGGGDLQAGYWDGTTWTNTANLDTSCTVPYSSSKIVATGWVKSSGITRSIIVYSDLNSPNINWFTGNNGVFTRQPDITDVPRIVNPQGYMEIEMNPTNPSELLYFTSDTASDLFAKRLLFSGTSTLTWSNSSNVALETTLPQIVSSPFAFSFWQR